MLACVISLHRLQKLIANGEFACQCAYLSLHACVTRSELLRNLEQFSNLFSPTNAHVEFIKTKLKLGRLLQHVSVYKETIIREPVSA